MLSEQNQPSFCMLCFVLKNSVLFNFVYVLISFFLIFSALISLFETVLGRKLHPEHKIAGSEKPSIRVGYFPHPYWNPWVGDLSDAANSDVSHTNDSICCLSIPRLSCRSRSNGMVINSNSEKKEKVFASNEAVKVAAHILFTVQMLGAH